MKVLNLKFDNHDDPDFYIQLNTFPGVDIPRSFSGILTVDVFYDDGFQSFSSWVGSKRDCNIAFDMKRVKVLHVKLESFQSYQYSMTPDKLLLLNLAERLLKS